MADERKARYRDISDGLLRQRRNILLISLLLPLFFLSGASLEKLNILGSIITVSNPEIIKYSLVILFGYFLLRYWQYYQEESYVDDMQRKMREHIYYLENRFLLKKAREKTNELDSSILKICFTDAKYSMNGRIASIPNNKDKVIFPFMRQCEFYIYTDDYDSNGDVSKANEFHDLISQPEYSNWTPLIGEKNGGKRPHYYREHLRYSIFRFNFLRFTGMLRYMINESYFTDYQLPFLIAGISALATIYAIFIQVV